MRKFLLLLAVAVSGLANTAFSQTDISIGTGTVTNTNTTYPAPLQDYFEGSRAQYLYLASELTAAGMSVGNINSIKFNVLALATDAGGAGAFPLEQFTIKIGTSTSGSLSAASWETVSSTVFGPVNQNITLGVNTFTFSSPFFWNGTDNLVVEICNGDPNNAATGVVTWTGNHQTPWTTGLAFNGSHTYRADNEGNLCGTASVTNNGTQTTRPNIVFNWTSANPCNGVPNPGTPNVTPSTVCLGDPISLSSTGVTVASGLTYQWEVSTAGSSGPWNAVPGATSISSTTTQSVTSWYRLTVTCTNTGDIASTAGIQVTSPPILGGNYVIDKTVTNPVNLFPNTNVFKSFNDAYNAIKCGINSFVVFNVATGTGPYNEQLIMTSVKGASAVNTVTFNGNGNVITFTGTAAERAVIKLKGTSHIRFDGLVINANTGTYGYGIQLMNNSDSNIVRNCTINASLTDITSNFAGIVINGTDAGPVATGTVLCDANEFLNNTIIGGYYGITLVATFSGGANGTNRFYGNNIREFFNAGMYVAGSYNTVIDSNFFSRPTRANVGDFNGILFTTEKNTNCTVTRNRISNPFGGLPGNTTLNFYGINFTNSAGSVGAENNVVNNLIYKVNGDGPVYGINNTASGYVYYLHNTISLDEAISTATGLTRGFSQQTAASGIIFYNNLITIKRGGSGAKHCIYLGANTLQGQDYNNYFINSASGSNNIGFYTGDKATLSAFQTATSQEASSLSLDPIYTDLNNGITGYTPVSSLMNDKGLYLGIPVADIDILNIVRSTTTPDIGAHEYTPPPCTVPAINGSVTVSATGVCPNTPILLHLNVGPYGSSQTFQWQSSASSSGPFNDLGNPKISPDTTILAPVSTTYYRMTATCGPSTTVSTNTVQLVVNPALPGGTYTINKTLPASYVPGVAGGNFISFNAAKAAMASCGILGPVIFNVSNGPYNEQLKLDSIAGTSALNTITFNGNGNTIAFASNNTAERATIKLNGADFIIFNNLTINSVGATTYGYGVHLINNADSNRFAGCTILSSTAAAFTGNYAAVVINGDPSPPITGIIAGGNSMCDGNVFDGNTIQGGSYGFAIAGNTGDPIKNNKFINNTVREFLAYGFYIAGTNNTLVEGNTITRLTRTVVNNAVVGIYMADAPNSKLVISKNRITKMFNANSAVQNNTNQFSGIYHNAVNQTANNENIVSNNAIYDIQGTGIQYALYNVSSSGVYYYHNTVSLDNSNVAVATARGFYQSGNASNIQFKNNIIAIRRAGTSASATRYGIYLETSSSGIASDYNDFFVNGTGNSNNYIGYYNSNSITTLTGWQGATGKDANSLNLDPLFTSVATGNLMPQLAPLDNKGTPIAGITTDILNAVRNNSTPDMGAWEFAPPPCVSPPVAGTASVTPNTGLCLDAPIQLNVTGHSPLGQITFQWQVAQTNSGPWTNIGPLLYTPQFNTTTTTSTWFQAVVTCSGVSTITPPVQITLNNILLSGTYTIDGTIATNYTPGNNFGNFHTFQEAVNVMLCGISGSVVFNVAPGTYNERIRIPVIPGTSASSTVTFQSANGNAASAELTYSADAANNYTLKLDNTKYFTFRKLTISATNVVAGRAVELAGTASYDSILNCIINAPVTSNVANITAGIYVSPITGTNLTLRGNTILNGANGIYFAGTGSSNLAASGHIIDSNVVTDAYSHGIFAEFTSHLKVTNNTVNTTTTNAAGSAGINLNYCDSAFRITGNRVNINNNTASGYGIQIANAHSRMRDSGIVNSNTIYANTGNTNTLYGLTVTASKGINVVNNVIGINSAGASAYGLYNLNNIDSINYYNNSCNISSSSGGAFAGYFNQSGTGYYRIYNNIFSNNGGGRSLFVNDATVFRGDYNLLYSSGANLVQTSTGPVTNFTSLKAWNTTFPIDKWSISYPPAFISNTDLRPDLTNPDVWAMHGRGTQIVGNSYDFNGAVRPETLTTGVPDLGAFEFHPTAQPTVLSAIPAAPAPNTTQTFYYGTDTVMRITWKAIAPPSVQTRRYSGDSPLGLGVRPDSMFFYTKVDIPGGGTYDYDMQLSYIDPWQGSIPQQRQIGLGRTTAGNSWVVGFNSKVDVNRKIISQSNINFLDRFSGLINPYAPPASADKDSSNRGKRFWVAYAINQLSGGQDMYLYLSAQEAANVRVKIYGTGYDIVYPVPANTVVVVPALPKTGPNNAFLNAPGLFDQGIEITSDVPIVAYAHATGAASSGAVMLLPVGVWGYDYKTLCITQNYGAGSFSYFYAIADSNNTKVEVTVTKPVQNAGFAVGVPTQVVLNKGQVLQIVATSQTDELTGSTVKSVANSTGKCYPIAVFSGSSRTAIDVGQCGSGGDFIMQQNFPSTAWGKKYLTAPTSLSTDATIFANNIFRVAVKDPATIVKRNGVVLGGLINGHYYQFTSSTADYIEANKPIMVAQFEGGACADGDPEMFYISPMEQGIDRVSFYRNDEQAIDENYLTMIIPTGGLASLVIKDGSTVVTPDYVIAHPQNALTGRNFSVVVKRWGTAAKSQVSVQSDSSFTAITYGQGLVESYGYNAGTLVKNLHATGTVSPVGGNQTDYTCANTPFHFVATFPMIPTSITWKLSNVPGITPATDTIVNNPVPSSVGTYPNGDPMYSFTLNFPYTISTLGIIPVQINYTHPDIEGCDHSGIDTIYAQVLPTPRTDFSISTPVCAGTPVLFNAQNYTSNGVAVNQWDWTFHTGATASGQNTSFTYPTAGTYNVKLHSVSPDGCIGDSIKQVLVNPLPLVTLVADSLAVCPGANATFTIASPLAGATYSWYNTPTGGTAITTGSNIVVGANGTGFTINNVSASADYYVEGVSSAGCTSGVRQKARLRFLPVLPQTVVTYASSTATTVTFNWTAVPGAVSYEVSTNNGTTWSSPSSGATGLTHTVSPVGTLQSVTLLVRVNGALACQASVSAPVSGCANSSASVVNASISVCTGTSATFNIQSPVVGITYNWYSAATGGTLLGTGSTFTSPAVSGTTSFYVEQVSIAGCTGSPRTQVTATILPPLAPPVITSPVADADRTVNSLTFRWGAVTGAGSYQVSIDNGTTWVTPSSGSTGLFHTITGLTPLQEVCLKVRAIGTIACQTSESVAVCAKARPDAIFIPNTFTPNSDGKNDVLTAYGFAIQSIQFMVFNQWGEKIHEVTTNAQNNATGEFKIWDGKYKGKVQPVGVYVYAAKITLKDGTVINKSGALNIVR